VNKYYNHIGVTVDEAGKHVGPNREAWLAWDDVFPTGLDGKRHPNKEELQRAIRILEVREAMGEMAGSTAVTCLLEKLLTVATEDKP